MIAKFRAQLHTMGAKHIAVGVVALSLFGITSVVGITHAAPAGKPTKEQCAVAGYRNYGQCVSQWAHNKGYGG